MANTVDGMQISGATTQSNLVEGNYIGVDATGTIDLGNTNHLIFSSSSEAVFINAT